jgi:hypothetical protein
MKHALTGYLQKLTEAREMLDGRYDDIKSGRVAPLSENLILPSFNA